VIKLWVNQRAFSKVKTGEARVDSMPDFDGEVDGQRVIAYIKTGMNGPFLSVLKAGRLGSGEARERVGAGRIKKVPGGNLELSLQMENGGARVALRVSSRMPVQLIKRIGWDADVLNE